MRTEVQCFVSVTVRHFQLYVAQERLGFDLDIELKLGQGHVDHESECDFFEIGIMVGIAVVIRPSRPKAPKQTNAREVWFAYLC